MKALEPLLLKPGEVRGAGPLNIFGDIISVKLSGTDTGGNYVVMETFSAPQVGPPLHRHSREDESFYVLESEYLFEVDGKQMRAGVGCSVFAPRGTVHTFQNIGTTGGRLLVIAQPAGMDDFFLEIAAASATMKEPDMAVLMPIFQKHGMELLGPPLGARPAATASRA